MNYRNINLMSAALALMLSAGVAAPVMAQSSNQAPGSTVVANTVDFRSSKWLSDRKVINKNGEEIAVVSDLILDRGWGRIEYLVITTGSTLGLGGRAVAIPYNAFKWDGASGKGAFVLASTAEQLKLFPEYTPESWKAMKETVSDDKNKLRERLVADGAATGDPYAGALDGAKQVSITGEVKRVERVRTTTFGEQVEIEVATADGSNRRITLGPSWYVNSAAAAPMRGDKVVVDTLALPRDPNQLLAGVHLKTGARELNLRESNGTPVWGLKAIESDGHSYSIPYSRYLLMSSLPGMKIDCRGSECGTVQDIILDRNSGEIGFLSIDPNENFLGIRDTKRMIPWSITSVNLAGLVRIDASKEMVLASPETPSDLSTLNSGTHAERVYKAFNVSAPRFQPTKP